MFIFDDSEQMSPQDYEYLNFVLTLREAFKIYANL